MNDFSPLCQDSSEAGTCDGDRGVETRRQGCMYETCLRQRQWTDFRHDGYTHAGVRGDRRVTLPERLRPFLGSGGPGEGTRFLEAQGKQSRDR